MMECITIHLKDVLPFLKKDEAQRIVLRYLHDHGIEGEIGDDEVGRFIRYYRPSEDIFEDFSLQLYNFITNYKKTNI